VAALHQSCGGDVVSLPAGLGLVNGRYLRLGAGFDEANVCDYADYRVILRRYGHRYGDRFDRGAPTSATTRAASTAPCVSGRPARPAATRP